MKVHDPALILLDLRMPIMDGWSFVQQYRRLAVVPAAIVLMSAAPDLPAIATQLGRRASGPPAAVPPADRPSSPPLT